MYQLKLCETALSFNICIHQLSQKTIDLVVMQKTMIAQSQYCTAFHSIQYNGNVLQRIFLRFSLFQDFYVTSHWPSVIFMALSLFINSYGSLFAYFLALNLVLNCHCARDYSANLYNGVKCRQIRCSRNCGCDAVAETFNTAILRKQLRLQTAIQNLAHILFPYPACAIELLTLIIFLKFTCLAFEDS